MNGRLTEDFPSEADPRVIVMTDIETLPSATIGSLSPSRASDFKTCPLLYRFRTIDRIPEAPSAAATRGTVIHSVLQRLYDLPASERTVDSARAMVEPVWQQLQADEPSQSELFADDPDGSRLAVWLESAYQLVDNYFGLEDPTRLEPQAREQLVEVTLDGLLLRGYVDRIDVTADGAVRIVDYKTGSLPREAFEAKALFQMKFYALVLWRLRGVVPTQLKLIYLADRDTLSYTPDATELERFEATLRAIWAAIARATELREFRPSPSRLCDWCDHHSRCPAFGGTPPPFPELGVADSATDRRRDSAVAVLPLPEQLPQPVEVHLSQ
jgi:putative RecB family exonuclease